MASRKKPVMLYRRKREGKTDYRARLMLLSSKKARLVIRKTNTKLLAQIIQYTPDGDKVLVGADTTLLRKQGWHFSLKNMPAAYLLGIAIAHKAKTHNIQEAIVDIGMERSIKGSRLYALVKGTLDGGLQVPCDVSVLPSQDRIEGKHISSYLETAGHHQFSQIKKNSAAGDLSKEVAECKKKLIQQ